MAAEGAEEVGARTGVGAGRAWGSVSVERGRVRAAAPAPQTPQEASAVAHPGEAESLTPGQAASGPWCHPRSFWPELPGGPRCLLRTKAEEHLVWRLGHGWGGRCGGPRVGSTGRSWTETGALREAA